MSSGKKLQKTQKIFFNFGFQRLSSETGQNKPMKPIDSNSNDEVAGKHDSKYFMKILVNYQKFVYRSLQEPCRLIMFR